MEIIIRNWEEMSLTHIPNNELETVIANNEEVITTISLTNTDKEKINNGCILNRDMSITEPIEYTEKIKTEANNKIREDKRIAIEKIATPSDQLNIIASILNTLTSPEPDLNLIADAKSKFAEIETVLAIPYIK